MNFVRKPWHNILMGVYWNKSLSKLQYAEYDHDQERCHYKDPINVVIILYKKKDALRWQMNLEQQVNVN